MCIYVTYTPPVAHARPSMPARNNRPSQSCQNPFLAIAKPLKTIVFLGNVAFFTWEWHKELVRISDLSRKHSKRCILSRKHLRFGITPVSHWYHIGIIPRARVFLFHPRKDLYRKIVSMLSFFRLLIFWWHGCLNTSKDGGKRRPREAAKS